MYTAVYTLAAVCMFVYTAVNMLAADGAVFTHLYSPPPSSAVSQRSEHEVHKRIARELIGCWKFLCISSLAQRSFSSGVSGSKLSSSLRLTAASLVRLALSASLAACRAAAARCHLASLACVVSCWRLVAILCRFARNLSALASSVSFLRVAAAL